MDLCDFCAKPFGDDLVYNYESHEVCLLCLVWYTDCKEQGTDPLEDRLPEVE